MAPTRAALKLANAATVNDKKAISSKRKAEVSPLRNEARIKRSALGNLTNAVIATESDDKIRKTTSGVLSNQNATKRDDQLGKKTNQHILAGTENVPTIQPIGRRTRASTNATETAFPPPPKIQTRAKNTKTSNDQQLPTITTTTKPKAIATSVIKTTAVKSKHTTEVQVKTSRRISNEFEKTEESLYVSALEDIPSDASRLSDSRKRESLSAADSSVERTSTQSSASSSQSSYVTSSIVSSDDDAFATITEVDTTHKTPDGVVDFDKENWNDPYQVSHYAMDIFDYLKTREVKYTIKDYIVTQPELSKWMRSLLVDWMVEVQESFELNHETLYLAVKIVDTFLSKERVAKDSLQLLGAAALLISCKFDERTPPLIDDFLFICDGAYKRSQLLKMEMSVFRTIDFDLGAPLSYRFLRRYARCGKVSMVTLTLARFILEYALMDYSTIQLSDSKMACAALFMSLRMNNLEGWNSTYEYYSGYKLMDFAPIVVLLNTLMHRKPKETLSTVRNKYSHKIFHQVTQIPLLDINKLFEFYADVAKKLSGTQLTYQSIIEICSSVVTENTNHGASDKKKPTDIAKRLRTMPLPLIG